MKKDKDPKIKRAKDNKEASGMQTIPFGPRGWIQWKGTDVCMDVHCACGRISHVDGDFVYHVKCPHCGRVYFCNGNIELIEMEEDSGDLTTTAMKDIFDT